MANGLPNGLAVIGQERTQRDSMGRKKQSRVVLEGKVGIEALEALLDAEEDLPIEILPDGTVVYRERKTRKKPITMRKDLGGEYSLQHLQ